MKESVFAGEIKQACSGWSYYYKIPDSYGMARFSPLKPFDSFVLVAGHMFALEFKMMKSSGAFPFSAVKEHQIEGLEVAQHHGATSFIIINYRLPKLNKSYAIHIDTFKDLKLQLEGERKSIPYKWFQEKTIEMNSFTFEIEEIERNKNMGKLNWDMIKLLSYHASVSYESCLQDATSF